MKKKLCATFLTLLALMVFATSVFAAEARWRNVTKITPIILASTNTYSGDCCKRQEISASHKQMQKDCIREITSLLGNQAIIITYTVTAFQFSGLFRRKIQRRYLL